MKRHDKKGSEFLELMQRFTDAFAPRQKLEEWNETFRSVNSRYVF